MESRRCRFVQLHERLSDDPAGNVKFLKFWPGDGEADGWARRLRRWARPLRARQMRGRAIWSLRAPEMAFPGVFRREGDLLLTSSRYVNFSEQPFVARHDDLRALFDWCLAHRAGHHTFWQGQTSYEIILNSAAWRRAAHPIGISDGIFAHALWDDSFRASHACYNPALKSVPGAQ